MLFFFFTTKEPKQNLLGYAYTGYLSDPYKVRSQTSYVFKYNEQTFHGDKLSKH